MSPLGLHIAHTTATVMMAGADGRVTARAGLAVGMLVMVSR